MSGYAALMRRAPVRLGTTRAQSSTRPGHLTPAGVLRPVDAHEQQLDRPAGARTIQAKLAIGSVGDPLEREADRIASDITADPAVPASGRASRVSRASLPSGSSAAPARPDETNLDAELARARQDGGTLLAPHLAAPVEAHLGLDLSGVRVHQNSRANHLAREIHARAFTAGRDIFFGPDAFRPDTRAGRQLLAHELVHVAQQGAASRTGAGPHIQRAMDFDKRAATATAKEVDASGGISDTMSLYWEFVSGLSQYFGFAFLRDPNNQYRIKGLLDTPDADTIRQTIAARFADPVAVQSAHGGYTSVDAADAVTIWTETREALRKRIKDGKVKVIKSSDQRLEGPMAAKDGEVHVKPDWMAGTYIRKESQWSLFWMLLHEILHLEGWKDAMSGNNAYASPLTEEREIALQGPAEKKSVSLIGDVEYRLNVIRIGLGLPVRTNYSDAPPEAAKFPTGKRPLGVFFADKPGPGQKEYVGSVMVDPALGDQERVKRAGDLFLPRDFDQKAHTAKRREAKAAAKGATMAPGLVVEKLRFYNDGVLYSQTKPPIKIAIAPGGEMQISGTYEYEVDGVQRKGAVSGGGFALDGNSIHILFDWQETTADGWMRRGTADLALSIVSDEYTRLMSYLAVEFAGSWTRSDQKAAADMSMTVTRIME